MQPLERIRPWESLSPAEQMRAEYSDLHKDVFGMRPDYSEVDSWDDEQLAVEFNKLVNMLGDDDE
jgi:hypothetical protein